MQADPAEADPCALFGGGVAQAGEPGEGNAEGAAIYVRPKASTNTAWWTTLPPKRFFG